MAIQGLEPSLAAAAHKFQGTTPTIASLLSQSILPTHAPPPLPSYLRLPANAHSSPVPFRTSLSSPLTCQTDPGTWAIRCPGKHTPWKAHPEQHFSPNQPATLTEQRMPLPINTHIPRITGASTFSGPLEPRPCQLFCSLHPVSNLLLCSPLYQIDCLPATMLARGLPEASLLPNRFASCQACHNACHRYLVKGDTEEGSYQIAHW